MSVNGWEMLAWCVGGLYSDEIFLPSESRRSLSTAEIDFIAERADSCVAANRGLLEGCTPEQLAAFARERGFADSTIHWEKFRAALERRGIAGLPRNGEVG